MTSTNDGGIQEEILDTTETDVSASETTPAEDNTKPDNVETDLDPNTEEVENQTEEEFWDGKTPLNKVKPFQRVVAQKNEFKTLAEQRAQENEALKTELEALKTSQPTKTDEQPQSQQLDASKYSDDLNELLTQLPEVKFENLFEYEKDENGQPVGYKDPSKMPKTMEDMANTLYPLFEKKMWERMGMVREIGNQKEAAKQQQLKSQEEKVKADNAKVLDEITNAFDGDKKAISEFFDEAERVKNELGENEQFSFRQFLKQYIKGYKKVPAVEEENLKRAGRVSTRSTRSDSIGSSTDLRESSFEDYVVGLDN